MMMMMSSWKSQAVYKGVVLCADGWETPAGHNPKVYPQVYIKQKIHTQDTQSGSKGRRVAAH